MGRGRYPYEKQTIIAGQVVPWAGVTTISREFPLGMGYKTIRLIINAGFDWTNSTVNDRHALYNVLNSVNLKTSAGEVIYNMVPGRAIYEMNGLFNHVMPNHDILIGADATYRAVLDLPLCFPFLDRPEDTILDTKRYSNLELQLVWGSGLDCVSELTGETFTPTLDVEVIRTMAPLSGEKSAQPNFIPYFTTLPMQVVTTNYWNIESALDFNILGFYIKCGATGQTKPFNCDGVDHLTSVSLRDSVHIWLDTILARSMREEWNQRVHFDPTNIYIATPAATEQIAWPGLGCYPHFFVQDGSINEAFPTGGKSQIQLSVVDGTATDLIQGLIFGYRAMR